MKAAIIGLGWQGKRHYEALKELGVELACVIDIDPEAVQKRVPDFPPAKIYSDGKKALSEHKPGVVSIATNASQRLNNVRLCTEAGVKKIFCEKPMATSLKDAREMKRLAEEAGCILAINHLRRWNPNYQHLQEVIASDAIGKVEHLYAQAGSVGLGNEGTHIIDKMRLASKSDIDWVMGFTDSTGTPNPRGGQYRDPAGWGMMQFKNGVRAFIDTCEDTGVPSVFEIVGTYGRIVVEELNNHWTIMARKREDRSIPLTKIMTPIHEQPVFDTLGWDVKEFTKRGLKELVFEGKTSCNADDGIKALEAVIAIHVSNSQDGRKIKLPLTEEYETFEVNWA